MMENNLLSHLGDLDPAIGTPEIDAGTTPHRLLARRKTEVDTAMNPDSDRLNQRRRRWRRPLRRASFGRNHAKRRMRRLQRHANATLLVRRQAVCNQTLSIPTTKCDADGARVLFLCTYCASGNEKCFFKLRFCFEFGCRSVILVCLKI